MKKKAFKLFSLMILSSLLVITQISNEVAVSDKAAVAAYGEPKSNAAVDQKDELIYGTLKSDGGVKALYAVNRFEVTEPGIITDYGDFSSVINLTDTNPVGLEDNKVSIPAASGQVYYQGNLKSKELPWLFTIQYSLNGAKVSPQDMAGKSGELEIKIKSSRNTSVNPVFYEKYILQISLTLDSENCTNINAQGAVIADSGKNRLLTFTIMPGSDADITISSSVKDFTMAGVDIAAMPFSMNVELPDTDQMLGEFQPLLDAISALNDGIKELNDGTAGLYSGAAELNTGSEDIRKGLNGLKCNSGQLTDASLKIKDALNRITQALNNSQLSTEELSGLLALPQGLSKLAAGLEDISGGLTALKNGFRPAYDALDRAISGIPDTELTQEQIQSLYAKTEVSLQPTLDTLVKAYTAAKTVQATYDQVKAAFLAVDTTLDQLSQSVNTVSASLLYISDSINSVLGNSEVLNQLPELLTGLQMLSENYNDFHDGLVKYTDGVDQLAGGFTEFQKGINALKDGTGGLAQGTDELYAGSSQLNQEVSALPDTIKEEMDQITGKYDSSDFKPVSFLSPQNTNVELVQFVIKSEAIKLPQNEADGKPSEQKKKTFWDRLAALFS